MVAVFAKIAILRRLVQYNISYGWRRIDSFRRLQVLTNPRISIELIISVVGELEDSFKATWELQCISSSTRIWFSNTHAIRATIVTRTPLKRVIEVLFDDHTKRKGETWQKKNLL